MSETIDLKNLPDSSGVYIFKDAGKKIIYVGKANNIRKRVTQYFKKNDDRIQVKFLLKRIKSVDFIITKNEQEALILENNLIKENQPKYNVKLKDDKNYYSIMLSTYHSFPAIKLVRQVMDKNALYYGPYASSVSARSILDQIVSLFNLRTCTDREFMNRKRACLKKDLGKCLAPCVEGINIEDYAQMVNMAKLFLSGERKEVLRLLTKKMNDASGRLNYELAGRLRDVIKNIKFGLKEQRAVDYKRKDADFWCLIGNESNYVASLVVVNSGVIKISKIFKLGELIAKPSDVMTEIMLQYYKSGTKDRHQIFCNIMPSNHKLVSSFIGAKIGLVSRRWQGPMELALENANFAFSNETDVLVKLKNWLRLEKKPETIEAFDVSHLGGKECYGALVRFDFGVPNKSKYRLFKIKDGSFDDYKMFHELMSRRVKHGDLPDLVLVDGGKGQLGVVKKIFEENKIKNVELISIAKSKDEGEDFIYKPDWKEGKRGNAGKKEYLLLKKIRDEVHRFGITAQRRVRSKKFS